MLVNEFGMLSVRGNKIVGENGVPLTLRGCSLFWSQWIPKYFNEGVVKWLRDDWGATVIRAPLAACDGGYFTNREAELAKIERIVDAAIALGVYVIVDWHAHEMYVDAACEVFSYLAGKYNGCPNIIYEIWNEPSCEYDWERDIKPYHRRVIGEIRLLDPLRLIVAGTENFSQHVRKAALSPLYEKNVAYSLHFYSASHKRKLRKEVESAVKRGIALFVTEYGISEASGDGVLNFREMRRWWKLLENLEIGYINWSIADKKESSAALSPGASITGDWSLNDLSPSGAAVRSQLRSRVSIRPKTKRVLNVLCQRERS